MKRDWETPAETEARERRQHEDDERRDRKRDALRSEPRWFIHRLWRKVWFGEE